MRKVFSRTERNESIARNIRISERVGDSARRVYDRAQAIVIEAPASLRTAALRSVARHQDQSFRHQLA